MSALAVLQVFLFVHVLNIINIGVALPSIGNPSVDRYAWLGLLCGLFFLIFWNFFSLASAFSDEEYAQKNLISIARRSVVALGLYVALEILNALTIFVLYGGDVH